MEDFKDLQPPVAIPLDRLDPNDGQLKERGLPENPRDIRDERYEQLKGNIARYPEFLRQNSLIVYPYQKDRYLIIGGNMRYLALRELGYEKAPCSILPVDTSMERLKAFVILDNSSFGQWSWAKLQSSDWSADELSDWGVDMPIMETDVNIDDFFEEAEKNIKEKEAKISIVVPNNLIGNIDEIKIRIRSALSNYKDIRII